ncbi:PaaI family thioesterase [Ideonella livida]|uniref:PaaI family thioesterase n=1 Tax=Ideonella livida TaxID=2707176 RepID=A0A7C9TLJ5_9BURK|nr:PaaI family thioesterase [Ideonella livida]NDY93421.1 PaaI family thioesterase [Ideonella livida]
MPADRPQFSAPPTESPEGVLARWQARADEVRTRLGPAGAVHPEQARDKTGMALFEAMFRGELPSAPIGHLLDFLPVEVEPGRAVFQGRPGRQHYNPLGTVHGGWFATLLDSAVACAVHTLLPAGKLYTTLELKLNIVRALTDRVPLVRAEGVVVHPGRQVATAEGRLYGPDGQLYAHASTTCLVFDARPA